MFNDKEYDSGREADQALVRHLMTYKPSYKTFLDNIQGVGFVDSKVANFMKKFKMKNIVRIPVSNTRSYEILIGEYKGTLVPLIADTLSQRSYFRYFCEDDKDFTEIIKQPTLEYFSKLPFGFDITMDNSKNIDFHLKFKLEDMRTTANFAHRQPKLDGIILHWIPVELAYYLYKEKGKEKEWRITYKEHTSITYTGEISNLS